MFLRALYTLLILVLLAANGYDAMAAKAVQAHPTVNPQIASLQLPLKTPCQCKTSLALGCSTSSPMGLSSCAAGFNAPGKLTFLTFGRSLLIGHKRPVPLPPPKV